jgi:type IX secretion system PorP/SprF family membrane protein
MKKSILLLAAVLVIFSVKAQQDPQLNHWMFDRMSFNPAATGMDRMNMVQAFYRTQWVNFSGQPRTFLFNYNGHFNFGGHDVGIGGSVFSDRLGQETNTIFRLHGSYIKNINGKSLSFGLTLGGVNKQIGNQWICSDPSDPTCRQDNAIPTATNQAATALDVGLGIMYYQQDNFYVGLSSTHLPAGDYRDLNMKSARHYYLMGGKNFPLNTAQPLVVRTNALVKTDLGATPSADLNANVLWNKMFWGGLSWRTGDAISPMVGFQYNGAPMVNGRRTTNWYAMLGYSYDITTSEIRTYSAGSHDIFVTFAWKVSETPLRVKYGNPRFL